jgi:hypothetical protein
MRSLVFIFATLSACAACSHRTSNIAQSFAVPNSPTVKLAQTWPSGPTPATFLSKETGKVLVVELEGDAHEPADSKRLFLELQRTLDVRKFVPLIESRALLRGATIYDPSSQTLYSFDAIVVGKRFDGPTAFGNVWITLKVTKLRVVGSS